MISELDKEILRRIITSNVPLSGIVLSNILHISINTLRKEIGIINDFIKDYGCQIDTRISVGYSLNIIDENIAIPFIRHTLRDINRYGYLGIADYKNENFIIRKVLCSSKEVPIEYLMDRLYCSKSTILRIIEKTRDYLKMYNLEIKTRRNAGLYIEGTEWNKRLCLINQHKIYKHEYKREDIGEFDALFLNNTPYHDQIRTIVLSNMPAYPSLAYAHIDVPVITNFIILLKTRHKYGSELSFTERQLREARSSPTCNLAKDIIDSLPDYFKADMCQNELDALNILLAGLRKYKSVSSFSDAHEYDRLYSIAKDTIAFVTKMYHVDRLPDKNCLENMVFFIKEQENAALFKVYRDAEFFDITNSIGLFSSDVTAMMAYYLHKYHELKLGLNALSLLYSIVNRTVYENEKSIYARRILVISRYSNYISENIAIRLQRSFRQFIESVRSIEYTDIPLIDVYEYDAIITDISNGLISIDLPIIEIEFNRSRDDFDEFENYLNGLYKTAVLKIFTPSDFIKSSFDSQEEVLKTIYNDINPEDISEEEWMMDVKTRESYVPFKRNKGIILITNLLYQSNKPVFRVYVNNSDMTYSHDYAHIIIYYNYGNGSDENIQNLSYLNKQFIHKDEQYLSGINDMTYDEVVSNFTLQHQR